MEGTCQKHSFIAQNRYDHTMITLAHWNDDDGDAFSDPATATADDDDDERFYQSSKK